MKSAGRRIYLDELIADYSTKVHNFHAWLRSRQNELHAEALAAFGEMLDAVQKCALVCG